LMAKKRNIMGFKNMAEAEASMRASVRKNKLFMKSQIRAGFDPVKQERVRRKK